MRAGRLRHRITIQKKSEGARNTFNERLPDYSDLATVCARVRPVRGTERFEADASKPQITHMIEMRYGAPANPGYRIIFKDRVFEIIYVIDVEERHIKLEAMCIEVIKDIP